MKIMFNIIMGKDVPSGMIWLETKEGDGPSLVKQFNGRLQREWLAFWMGIGSFLPKITIKCGSLPKITIKCGSPRRVIVTEFKK